MGQACDGKLPRDFGTGKMTRKVDFNRASFIEPLVERIIFDLYEKDFLAGHRVINNFLCFTGSGVQEVAKGDLAGAFYRYHSSKALYDLSEYIFNNARPDADLAWLARHTRLDMLLHAQNMADCAIKDTRNRHSIDGILEVMVAASLDHVVVYQLNLLKYEFFISFFFARNELAVTNYCSAYGGIQFCQSFVNEKLPYFFR
jgi:hypothetical protein